MRKFFKPISLYLIFLQYLNCFSRHFFQTGLIRRGPFVWVTHVSRRKNSEKIIRFIWIDSIKIFLVQGHDVSSWRHLVLFWFPISDQISTVFSFACPFVFLSVCSFLLLTVYSFSRFVWFWIVRFCLKCKTTATKNNVRTVALKLQKFEKLK